MPARRLRALQAISQAGKSLLKPTYPSQPFTPLPRNQPLLPLAPLAITDEASPFALRSTRKTSEDSNAPGGCSVTGGQEMRDDAPTFVPKTTMQSPCQKDLPETVLHATSRRPTTQPMAAPYTCSVTRVGEVVHGDVTPPHINGMQGSRLDRPCRARPADRSLVAEVRSAGGVRDQTRPGSSRSVLGPQLTGEPWTTVGTSGHQTIGEIAGRSTYSLLTSGGGEKRRGVRVSPPPPSRAWSPTRPLCFVGAATCVSRPARSGSRRWRCAPGAARRPSWPGAGHCGAASGRPRR